VFRLELAEFRCDFVLRAALNRLADALERHEVQHVEHHHRDAECVTDAVSAPAVAPLPEAVGLTEVDRQIGLKTASIGQSHYSSKLPAAIVSSTHFRGGQNDLSTKSRIGSQEVRSCRIC
jgi:hypothetical protein